MRTNDRTNATKSTTTTTATVTVTVASPATLATPMTRKNINICNNNVRVLQQQNHFDNNKEDPYKRRTTKQHKEKSTSTSTSTGTTTTSSNTKTKKKKTYTMPLHRSSFNQSPSSSPRSHDAVRPASSSVQTAPAVLTTSRHGTVPSTISGGNGSHSSSSSSSQQQSSHHHQHHNHHDDVVSVTCSGAIVRGKFSNNTKATTPTKDIVTRGSTTMTTKSTFLPTSSPLHSNMVQDASASASVSTSTISNASAPTANPTSSSSKKSRHRLTSFFQFRKRRENPLNNTNTNRPNSILKSKSALLTEFSLLMNEFPAQDALNTTLHVACLKHYSQELIVHQLIAKGPTAVSMRNQSKDLPLHCAMKCRMGIGVENEVYDALVGIYPVGIQAVNGDGCLPIHLACQSGGRNLYVIQKLVQAYPLGLIQRCDLKLPFGSEHSYLSLRYVSVAKSGSGSGSGSGRSSDWDVGMNSNEKQDGSSSDDGVNDNGVDSDKNTPKKLDTSEKQERTWGSSFWSALLALSPMSTSSSLDQAESNDSANTTADPGMESLFTPLHLAVMNGAPPDVIEMLLDANPMSLSIKTDRGRTPLDIAEFLIAQSHHSQQQQQQHIKKKDDKVDKGPEYYLENIDRDPIQNVIAAREILKTFQRNQKKSMHLIQAAKMTSLSIADLTNTSLQEFDSEKAWKKLSHVIKFTKSLQKEPSNTASGLGPLIGLDKSTVVEPPNYKLPPNLSHLCVDIDIPVGFRRLRWAMMSSKSKFLTQDVMENKLGFSEIQMSAWDKFNDDIGQTETQVLLFDSPASTSIIGAQRNCQYIMPKSGLVKANMAYETHTIVEYNDYVFVTHKITKTPEVPFGSSFESHVKTIIVNMGKDRCRMIASVEAKFLDKPPMIAWKIKSAMYSGVTDYL